MVQAETVERRVREMRYILDLFVYGIWWYQLNGLLLKFWFFPPPLSSLGKKIQKKFDYILYKNKTLWTFFQMDYNCRISRSLKNGTAVRNFICGGEMMVGTCHIAIAIAIVLSLMGFCINQPSPFVGGPSTRGASLQLGPWNMFSLSLSDYPAPPIRHPFQ